MNTSSIKDIPGQLGAQWQKLSRRARVLVVGALVAAVGAIAVLTTLESRVDYALLYANLDQEDAAAIQAKLKEQHVPHRISPDGGRVEIPAAQVAEVRLQLASSGLPRGGGVGYEIFDRQALGLSEHTQKINYQRALQGELERSVSTLSAVRRARVHLVLPEKSLFATPEQAASAAVVLNLHPGRSLEPDQVQGIVHLVASSVEGLAPARVTVVDQNQRLLSKKAGADAVASSTISYQRELEQTLSSRAQAMLERTLGPGHAVVQVNAQVDTAQVERTQEEFDPNGQTVRSEQEVEDVLGAAVESAGGIAGARANLPGGPPPQVTPTEGSRRRSSTKNYEISKTVKKITEPLGRVQRLTVAVLVDDKRGEAAGKAGGAAATLTKVRSKEELEAYAALVREAVGFDGRRGDQLVIQSFPFAAPEDAGAVVTPMVPAPPYLIGVAALGLLALGALLWRLRARHKVMDATLITNERGQFPASVRQLEEQLEPARALEHSGTEAALRARQQVLEMIANEPERAVRVLRAWINQPPAEQPPESAALALSHPKEEKKNHAAKRT